MASDPITLAAAQLALDKLTMSKQPMGLFVTYTGSWSLLKIGAQNFVAQMKKNPDAFRGIFDESASIQTLYDELADAGVK